MVHRQPVIVEKAIRIWATGGAVRTAGPPGQNLLEPFARLAQRHDLVVTSAPLVAPQVTTHPPGLPLAVWQYGRAAAARGRVV